jgi:predicted Rossmann fold flavoprotein
MKIAVIGGGAGGFFSAINIKQHHPQAQIFIFEKTNKLLSKVAVSGGGRCNVTHACFEPTELAACYPRGGKFLKKLFYEFNPQHTVAWFENHKVALKTEEDGRIFPVSDSSQTIINCFLEQAQRQNIRILTQSEVCSLEPLQQGFEVSVKHQKPAFFDKVILAIGGQNKWEQFAWLKNLNLKISKPVPSLFTFNMPQNPIRALMGLSAWANVAVKTNKKLQNEGNLLITHWGMSGPAILKLSAWGARDFAEQNYQFEIRVSWLKENEDELREKIKVYKQEKGAALPQNHHFTDLPKRLWGFLLEKTGINLQKKWADLNKNEITALCKVLLNDTYPVSGKTTYKEEFVTCGGIALDEINPQTMASKQYPDLYFTGEVLDIDGITGGFNFQAAWTTAWVAAQLK